ncbi:MAG: 4Fe-4S binding protein [Gemmataceae bacterium]|nr:4Fe-4S binding protein [Gemmataceae bacterium]
MISLAAVVQQWPALDSRRCTACGLCVTICPTRCLSATPWGPWLARPLDCLACAACISICPQQALYWRSIPPESPEDESSGRTE